MGVLWTSTAHKGPAEELASGYGAQVVRAGALDVTYYPNYTGWYCDDSASGANTTFNPSPRRSPPTRTAYRDWPLFLVEIDVAMGANTNWNLARTNNQAVNRPSILRIIKGATNTNFDIVDSAGTVLATGSTNLAVGTAYMAYLDADDTGANRTLTLYLWNGSAWVSEVTATGGGAATDQVVSGFGHSRAKGEAGSGGKFIIANIHSCYPGGDGENAAPTKPRYMLGIDPTGAGTRYDEWPGNAADVDDTPNNDGDTTYDESGTGTAVERQTYVMENPTIPASQDIVCVTEYCTARTVSGTLGDHDFIFTDGSTDVFVSVATQFGATYSNQPAMQELAPGSVAWTSTLVNASELGLRRQAAASDPTNLRLTSQHGYVVYKAQDAAPAVTVQSMGGPMGLGVGVF